MHEEHFIKCESFLCDECLLFCFWKVDVGEGMGEGGEMQSSEDVLWNEIWDIVNIFFQDVADLPSEKFRSKSGSFGIDGDETSGMSLIALCPLESGIGEKKSFFVGGYFSGDTDFHPGLDRLCDEFLVEPDDADGS